MTCAQYIGAYLAVWGRHPGPFFKFATGTPLSGVALVGNMRAALRPSGVDVSKYVGQSFRIGAATKLLQRAPKTP